MTEPSKVLKTQYTVKIGVDYTDAKVRVAGTDVWVRVGGFKANEEGYPALIEAAEQRYREERGVNGSVVI
jgi:hypothetical protein